MSFIESNQYFFKNQLQSKTKGLSQSDRERFYKRELQFETRERLKNYFRESIDVNSKVRDFEQVVILLKDLEFEYILLSIYFDIDADTIFKTIGKVLNECMPNNFTDSFQLTRLFRNRSSQHQPFADNHLKAFFLQYIEISEKDWLNKDVNYDLIKKANSWLGASIRDNKSIEYITHGLIHYTKFWSLYYSNPYQYDKGIILLNDMLNHLKSTSESQRSLFKRVLSNLSTILINLACKVPVTPFLDLREKDVMKAGYVKKLGEVVTLLEDTTTRYQMPNGPTYKELIALYFSSDLRGQVRVFDRIREKLLLGDIMANDEIDYLENFSSSVKSRGVSDNKRLHKEIIRMQYLYIDLSLH